MKKLLVAFALLVSVTALGGCTDADKEPDSGDQTPNTGATDPGESDPSDAATGETGGGEEPEAGISPPLRKIPKVKDAKGAINALSLGECQVKPGRQQVGGTVTSTAQSAADYLVTVSWTTGTGDVMGRGFAVLQDLDPGESMDFTIKTKVKAGAEQCVPIVVYGTIA